MSLSKKCSALIVVLHALLLVVLLQFVYFSKFQGKQQWYHYSELFGVSGPRSPEKNSLKDRLRYSLSTGGILDNSGMYRVYTNLIKSDQNPNSNILTLATHTSLNNLHHLEALVERWQNPLSVAIFAHSQDIELVTAVVYALSFLCPHIQALVDFHLICLSGEMASFPEQDHESLSSLDNCATAFSRLESYRDKYKNYAINNISYPNNLLRNVALETTQSPYVLVMDIDLVPSAELHRHFLAMVLRDKPALDQVFVLPTFEIRNGTKMPATKAELVQLYLVHEVQPFYKEPCPSCQGHTNYLRWISHVQGSDALEVAYTPTWTYPWEPFYIGSRGMPRYNESFKQFGLNRISQACELHVAGYRFSVLNSAFLVHHGFKIKGEFHATKSQEIHHNQLRFGSFKKALKSKYPSSNRRC